jgi:hypothetical protein
MKRIISGLWLGALVIGLGFNCSEKDDEDEDNDNQGTGGVPAFVDSGPEEAAALPPCESLEGPALEGCEWTSSEAQALDVNMLLVVDKSGSMRTAPAGYPASKWETLKQALNTALAEVQGAISFGLEFFPSSNTPGSPIPDPCGGDVGRCCEMPTGPEMIVQVGPGEETVPAIAAAFESSQPVGGTPTARALARAFEYFTTGYGSTLPGGKYVLLATDGGPNCNSGISCSIDTCTLNLDETDGCPSPDTPGAFSCCTNSPEACLDDVEATAWIEQLRGAGVTTIVVGIPGAEIYTGTLDGFANAGGFARQDAEEPYYLVSAEGGVAELTDTFREITTQLVTDCEVPLGDVVAGQDFNPNEVNVAVDCVIIPMESSPEDTVSRWRYNNPTNPTSVIIVGDICDEIQTTGVERIDVVLGCPVVTVE